MKFMSAPYCSFQWKLDVALKEDYKENLFQNMLRLGIKDIDRDNVIRQYWNMQKRLISDRPRRVVYSKEFHCPEEYERALAEFEERVRKGGNLHPFMSDKILKSSYNDLLLNDWNIYHFHLTRRFRDDGFAARNKYEIFAYVTDDAFYMVQIYLHSEDHLYSKQEMVRIIRDNWPGLLERFHLNGVSCLSEKVDDSSYEMLRKAHISTMVELGENEVYGMIGGGYASNGYSVEALRKADFWEKRLEVFQNIVVDNAGIILKTIEENFDVCSNPYMNIKLLWMDHADKVTLAEKIRNLVIQIDVKANFIRICEPYEVFMDSNKDWMFSFQGKREI